MRKLNYRKVHNNEGYFQFALIRKTFATVGKYVEDNKRNVKSAQW